MTKKLTPEELIFIKEASSFLENESILIKIANVIGKPLELLHQAMPESLEKNLNDYIQKSLNGALKIAIKSSTAEVNNPSFKEMTESTSTKRTINGSLSALSGAVGGFSGEPGLIVELPITTTLIMRNIVDVATQFEGIRDTPEFSLQCLEVFTLGSSKSTSDDEMDSSYYTTRVGLAALMKDGTAFLATNSSKVVLENVSKGTASPILNFISRIAAQFELVVAEKMLAEMIPVVGAVGGAIINVTFTDYYGTAAKYHFGLIYLENKYGKEFIQEQYEKSKELEVEAA